MTILNCYYIFSYIANRIYDPKWTDVSAVYISRFRFGPDVQCTSIPVYRGVYRLLSLSGTNLNGVNIMISKYTSAITIILTFNKRNQYVWEIMHIL